jgi:hypothetical protein
MTSISLESRRIGCRRVRANLGAIAGVLSLAAGPASGSAFAQGELSPTLQTCLTRNCGSLTVPGRVNAVSGRSNAWVGQFSAKTGDCLRFEIIRQSADLAMTVVDPRGTVYANLDIGSGRCPSCPFIAIRRVTHTGYHTAVINLQGAPGNASFTMRVGRYVARNPNCSPATPANRP